MVELKLTNTKPLLASNVTLHVAAAAVDASKSGIDGEPVIALKHRNASHSSMRA